jgi:hypothetical protein
MDPQRFDALTKTLSVAGTRRDLVRRLATLPLGMTLTALLGVLPAAEAKKNTQKNKDKKEPKEPKPTIKDPERGSSHRQHRRKAEHRHQTGNSKEHRKGQRKGKGKDNGTDTATCTPTTCAAQGKNCGTIGDGCGNQIRCGPCPMITAFSGTPRRVDQGGTTPESATLSWSASDATSCSIDNGIGAVNCDGNTTLTPGPDTTTTYTLTAVGAGGDEVTAQVIVEVQYCHSITFSGSDCTTGNTQFCRSAAITPSSGADAGAACEACYGQGMCGDSGTCGGVVRDSGSTIGLFSYSLDAGKILTLPCTHSGSRWAP